MSLISSMMLLLPILFFPIRILILLMFSKFVPLLMDLYEGKINLEPLSIESDSYPFWINYLILWGGHALHFKLRCMICVYNSDSGPDQGVAFSHYMLCVHNKLTIYFYLHPLVSIRGS